LRAAVKQSKDRRGLVRCRYDFSARAIELREYTEAENEYPISNDPRIDNDLMKDFDFKFTTSFYRRLEYCLSV